VSGRDIAFCGRHRRIELDGGGDAWAVERGW
jgi:hypothetical protein